MGVAGGETQLQDRMPPKGKRGRPKKGDEKKQRKKKDPNAPKRPMSAYFLFMNATRPQVRKENPDASIGEVAKIMGKMWGEIEPADKAKYDIGRCGGKEEVGSGEGGLCQEGKTCCAGCREWGRGGRGGGGGRGQRIEMAKLSRVKRNQRAQLRIHPS